jgi:hypothetical protein
MLLIMGLLCLMSMRPVHVVVLNVHDRDVADGFDAHLELVLVVYRFVVPYIPA